MRLFSVSLSLYFRFTTITSSQQYALCNLFHRRNRIVLTHHGMQWILYVLLAVALLLLNQNYVLSQDRDEAAKLVDDILRMRSDLQRDALKALLLMKRLHTPVDNAGIKVRPVRTDVLLREAASIDAKSITTLQMSEEHTVLNREDEWYRIALKDNRRGWVQKTDVQVTRGAEESTAQVEQEILRDIISHARLAMHMRYDSASAAISSFNEIIASRSPSERRTQSSSDVEAAGKKMAEYVEYVDHFYQKYSSIRSFRQKTFAVYPGPIQGTVGLSLGTSSHNSSYVESTKQSLGTKRFEFSGSMPISESSKVAVDIDHTNTIIQTPFSSTNILIGHTYSGSDDLAVESFASLNSFSDNLFARNNFKQVTAGSGLRYQLSSGVNLASSLQYDGKSFSEESLNNYNGLNMTSLLRMRISDASDVAFGLNGAYQSSDVSYLSYHRLTPHFRLSDRSSDKTFTLKAEAELLGYTNVAKANTYIREQLELIWTTETTMRQVTVIAKQFPDNPIAGYIRAGGMSRWRTTSGASSNASALSFFYHYFPQRGSRGSDYTELRLDQSSRSTVHYFEVNAYNRYWINQSDSLVRDHILDAMARVGVVTDYGQIGPLVGAHMLLRSGEKSFKRDGNSFRLGIEAETRFTISIARVAFTVRYEKNFVYGTEITIDQTTGVTQTGALRERHPTTFSFGARVDIPVIERLDCSLDLNSYDITTDVDDGVSINPVPRKRQFNVLAGLRYRFGS